MRINEIEETFTKYVANSFDLTDPFIKRKFAHSFRVENLCQILAEQEGLSKEDQEIASISGLLHDYARFYQWTNYHTFNDLQSIDHGNSAIDFLFKDNEINNYTSDIRNYDEIFDAIKYHNKYDSPTHLSQHNQQILNIVKDADKIDIWYLLSMDELHLEDIDNTEPIHEEIIQDFMNHRLIRYTKNMNGHDYVIAYLAYIFDLNYKSSFEYIYENNLIDKIWKQVIDQKKFKKYFDIVNEYLKLKLGE